MCMCNCMCVCMCTCICMCVCVCTCICRRWLCLYPYLMVWCGMHLRAVMVSVQCYASTGCTLSCRVVSDALRKSNLMGFVKFIFHLDTVCCCVGTAPVVMVISLCTSLIDLINRQLTEGSPCNSPACSLSSPLPCRREALSLSARVQTCTQAWWWVNTAGTTTWRCADSKFVFQMSSVCLLCASQSRGCSCTPVCCTRDIANFSMAVTRE